MSDLELFHYGVKYRSGRYPYGSGEDPFQHDPRRAGSRRRASEQWSYEKTAELRKKGIPDKAIAEAFGISQKEFRRLQKNAHNKKASEEAAVAREMYNEKGMSMRQIAEALGTSSSQVSKYIHNQHSKAYERDEGLRQTLRDQVKKHHHLDVGSGNEQALGITKDHLEDLIKDLQDEGYVVSKTQVQQAGMAPGNKTTIIVLSEPGTSKWYVKEHKTEVRLMDQLTSVKEPDGSIDISKAKHPQHDPVNIDPSRVTVRYAEDGGKDRDGTMEIRRGVQDLDMGDVNFAQVRVAVGGTHYLKGMAVYGDDKEFPPGVDIIFNTNKKKGVPAMDPDPNAKQVFKPQQRVKDENGVEHIDKASPFGTPLKHQNDWYDDKGVYHEGALNILKEQGDWRDQQLNLASQMLAKQSPAIAKRQLDIDYDRRSQQLDDILSMTNPVIKRKMLSSFEQECDSAAVHLKAAAMPRQTWNVLLPGTTLEKNEIYAPNFKDGEQVAVIRYPHAGPYEIVDAIVNNNNKECKRFIGDAVDAVALHPSNFDKLSGADCDGDTVLVIPNPKRANNKRDIQSAPTPKALLDFDPKDWSATDEHGKLKPGVKLLTEKNKGKQMGIVSNLIMDMYQQGATEEEMVRATKQSMVVIDAVKHKLDYKASEEYYDIADLKANYQRQSGDKTGGAATLFTRAKSPVDVPERRKNHEYSIDPATGEKIWNYTNKTKDKWNKPVIDPETGDKTFTRKLDKDGNPIIEPRIQKSTRMYETNDARTLMSGPNHEGTKMEHVYANYANRCKALANRARKEMLTIKENPYNKDMAKIYAKEVSELQTQLKQSKANSPYERQAQILAEYKVSHDIKAHEDRGEELSFSDIQKKRARAITAMREQVGAKKHKITFTDRQWEAIQKGAVRKTTLIDILNNADEDDYKKRAMPNKRSKKMNAATLARARRMLAPKDADGNPLYSQADVAKELGISPAYLNRLLTGAIEL